MSTKTPPSRVKSRNTKDLEIVHNSLDTNHAEMQDSHLSEAITRTSCYSPHQQARCSRPPPEIASQHLELVAARLSQESPVSTPEDRQTGTQRETQRTAVSSGRGGRMRNTAAEVEQIFDPLRHEPLAFKKRLASGTFGDVYRGKLSSGRCVAIKQVVEDPTRFSVRHEAEICRLLAPGNHPNIVEVLGMYYTNDERGTALNLVMEYVPKTLRSVLLYLEKRDMRMKKLHVQSYAFQLARALLFLHSHDVVHRDLKPENVLINPETQELKLSDFGSAKKLLLGRPSVTYICSRYYRAPELIIDRDLYGTAVDIWSYGCILAELAIGTPLFIGTDNASQLAEIIKVLGSISQAEAESMPATPDKQQLGEFRFPKRSRRAWGEVLTVALPCGRNVQTSFGHSYESLLDRTLCWVPSNRYTSNEILTSPFFEELKTVGQQSVGAVPNCLFDLTDEELNAIEDAATQGTAGTQHRCFHQFLAHIERSFHMDERPGAT